LQKERKKAGALSVVLFDVWGYPNIMFGDRNSGGGDEASLKDTKKRREKGRGKRVTEGSFSLPKGFQTFVGKCGKRASEG